MSAQGFELCLGDIGAHVGKLFGEDVDDMVLDLVVDLNQTVVHETVLVALLQDKRKRSEGEITVRKRDRASRVKGCDVM